MSQKENVQVLGTGMETHYSAIEAVMMSAGVSPQAGRHPQTGDLQSHWCGPEPPAEDPADLPQADLFTHKCLINRMKAD